MQAPLITIAIPLLVLLSVWLPEIAHYHVDTASISDKEIETLRHEPSNSTLQEFTTLNLNLGVDIDLVDGQLIHVANTILEGKLSLPGYETFQIQLPFNPDDLELGLSTWKLMFASLVAPEILIGAYNINHDERYYELARDMILAWARYEKEQWLPKGLLWNGHAIAARTTVLSKFWRIYRARDDFKLDEARLILQFALRNGEMLAKAEHFTAATNHGIMQNVALLNIATVFPTLPQVEKFQQIAYQRLQDQLAFYINDEGVVLEHSAGYHELGIMLIEAVLRYAELNGVTPPVGWNEKYEKGKRFLATIKRLDGTLPLFGNTLSQSLYTKPLPAPFNDRMETLYPVSGFSIWWRDYKQGLSIYPYSQTIMTWSHFSGHGHKLADEMSVLIWADGQNWITNTGYWPYGVLGREQVDSWEGSNAPHLAGESKNSSRETKVLSYLTEEKLAFSHLRRTGPNGFSAERQVIQLGEDLWVVIDYTADQSPRQTTTTWTFASDLYADNGNWPGQLILSKPAFSCMTASFASSEETEPKHYKGSKDPFAGWVVTENNRPRAAQSVVIDRPSDNTWSVAVFLLGKDCHKKLIDQPKMVFWDNPESWNLVLNLPGDEIRLERKDQTVLVSNVENETAEYILWSVETDAITRAQNKITSAFNRAAEKYQRYNPNLILYRIKISYVLLAILIAQLLFLFLYTKMKLPFKNQLKILGNVVWVMLGCYLYFIFFKS